MIQLYLGQRWDQVSRLHLAPDFAQVMMKYSCGGLVLFCLICFYLWLEDVTKCPFVLHIRGNAFSLCPQPFPVFLSIPIADTFDSSFANQSFCEGGEGSSVQIPLFSSTLPPFPERHGWTKIWKLDWQKDIWQLCWVCTLNTGFEMIATVQVFQDVATWRQKYDGIRDTSNISKYCIYEQWILKIWSGSLSKRGRYLSLFRMQEVLQICILGVRSDFAHP